eukprot:15202347-Heterocapsa_arctica.AAC.1
MAPDHALGARRHGAGRRAKRPELRRVWGRRARHLPALPGGGLLQPRLPGAGLAGAPKRPVLGPAQGRR